VSVLDRALAHGREWVLDGPSPSIADLSSCGYLVRADETKVGVPVHVEGWLARLRNLPAWRDPVTMLSV